MWLTVLEYLTEQGGLLGMWLTVLEYVTEPGGIAGDVVNSFRVCN